MSDCPKLELTDSNDADGMLKFKTTYHRFSLNNQICLLSVGLPIAFYFPIEIARDNSKAFIGIYIEFENANFTL